MNEGAKLVNIDFTMAIQIINFIVLIYFFSRAFAKKIGKVLEDRKKLALSEMEIVENEKEKLEEQKKLMEKLKKESMILNIIFFFRNFIINDFSSIFYTKIVS